MTQSDHLRRIRGWLAVFIIGLVLSGITAFPLETELSWLASILHADWLAFAHLVIAVAFFGPYIDPVRNKWVITFGLIACVGVIPLALIAGAIRGIPLPWRLVDCSFGFFSSVPLLFIRQSICALEPKRAR